MSHVDFKDKLCCYQCMQVRTHSAELYERVVQSLVEASVHVKSRQTFESVNSYRRVEERAVSEYRGR